MIVFQHEHEISPFSAQGEDYLLTVLCMTPNFQSPTQLSSIKKAVSYLVKKIRCVTLEEKLFHTRTEYLVLA